MQWARAAVKAVRDFYTRRGDVHESRSAEA
jgi:hypothetical protein